MKECVTLEWGGRPLVFETGRMAKQADGAILAQYGETVVLVTVVASKNPREGADFFPLSVDYVEKTYAAGKIPGGFFKREGRPGTSEILSARFIDRTLRPLFPDGFFNEVQIIATVLSADVENDPDILAIVGASAALNVSNIPFTDPIGAVRIGLIDDELIVNPTHSQIQDSQMDLVVAATQEAIAMVEGEAKEVSEEKLIEALALAHAEIRKIVTCQQELAKIVGKQKNEVSANEKLNALVEEIKKVKAS